MKHILAKKAMPKDWTSHPKATGILREFDVRVKRGDKLRAKVLVFSGRSHLRNFWMHCLGLQDLGESVLAVSNKLAAQYNHSAIIEHDPNYFCVMGFIKSQLTYANVAHESVHAAHNYAERSRTAWPGELSCPEERICYPTGYLTEAIVKQCQDLIQFTG